MKLPFTGDARAARFAMRSLLSRWRCFNATVAIASGRRAARVLVWWLSRWIHSSWTRGSPRYHFKQSAAGFQHKRGFCPECGSRITEGKMLRGHRPIVGINAASLDDPSWFRPQYDIFTSDAQPWDYMNPALPKFKENMKPN